MPEKIHENKIFKDIDYSEKNVNDREFTECTFINCNLSSSDFSRTDFTECLFENCNLSLMKVEEVVFNDVKFVDCKMNGIDFSVSNEYIYIVDFVRCYLDYSSFYRRKMPKTVFNECSLKDVDFFEANLKESKFLKCDFLRAQFSHTNLEKCDFTSAYDFTIDPAENRMKKAKFSINEIMGLLGKHDIIIEA
jgi:uncharacterized protein YjbI with pentapeptide repeats